MDAILGKSFNQTVKQQIQTRQRSTSAGRGEDDAIKVLNAKAPFIRLTSGIDLEQFVVAGLDPSIPSGNALAKKYILQGAWFDGFPTQGVGYSSIYNTNTTSPSPSYGFASTPFFGYVPPPGIVMANVESLNRGSLREATINIICHNLAQFKVIHALFLRLKYSLLLEWGHSLYFDNEYILQNNIWDLSSTFINGKITQQQLLELIQTYRTKSNGNYDAFFGLVKNFTWELLDNGGYNITISALSTGDVIESLKINTNINPESTSKTPIEGEFKKSSLHSILGYIVNALNSNSGVMHGVNTGAKSLCSQRLANLCKIAFNYRDALDDLSVTKTSNSILEWSEGKTVKFSKLEQDSKGNTVSQQYITLGTLLRIIESFLLYYDVTKSADRKSPAENVPVLTSGSTDLPELKGFGYPPVFYINHDYNINECLTIPNQVSLDPRVCLIPLGAGSFKSTGLKSQYLIEESTYKIRSENGGEWFIVDAQRDEPYESQTGSPTGVYDIEIVSEQIFSSTVPLRGTGLIEGSNSFETLIYPFLGRSAPGQDIEDTIKTKRYTKILNLGEVQSAAKNGGNLKGLNPGFRTDNGFTGKTMFIYVNVNQIMSSLDRNIDRYGNVSMFNFLQDLLASISRALGGINDFELIYRDDINSYFIIDNAFLPLKYNSNNPDLNPNDITRLNINLLRHQPPSTGAFVNKVNLRSELTSEITNALAVGAQEKGNALISNSTTFAKFNKGLIDRISTNKQNINSNPDNQEDFATKYKRAYNDYQQYVSRLITPNTPLTTSDTQKYQSSIIDLFQYDLGNYTENDKIPGTGFIPISLGVTMDGISGIKQYQTFEIEDYSLPNEYRNRIRFITKRVGHHIDEKGWETTMDTLSVPRGNLSDEIKIPFDPILQPNSPYKFTKLSSLTFTDSTVLYSVQQDLRTWGSGHNVGVFNDANFKRFDNVASYGGQDLPFTSFIDKKLLPTQPSNLSLDPPGSTAIGTTYSYTILKVVQPNWIPILETEINKIPPAKRKACLGSEDPKVYISFALDFLIVANLRVNLANLLFITQWFRGEETAIKFNPLATKWDRDTATRGNSSGVKAYANATEGVIATAKTILQPNYYRALTQAFGPSSYDMTSYRTPYNIWTFYINDRGDGVYQ